MTVVGKAGMTAKDDDHDHGKGVASWKSRPSAMVSLGDKLWHGSNRKRIIAITANRSIG